VAAPNQAWAGDMTYIPTEEGWLFLAVVIDLRSEDSAMIVLLRKGLAAVSEKDRQAQQRNHARAWPYASQHKQPLHDLPDLAPMVSHPAKTAGRTVAYWKVSPKKRVMSGWRSLDRKPPKERLEQVRK
jgi:hypothetical protein